MAHNNACIQITHDSSRVVKLLICGYSQWKKSDWVVLNVLVYALEPNQLLI